MTAPNPLVSVIVPAFNAAATLEETLGAVAAQTYRPIELLVVDDGSSDATGKIAEAFCRQHDFAQVIVQANAGVAAARNRAIAVAKGDYIAPLDADDIWHETYLVRAGDFEAVYNNMPVAGLGQAGRLIPAKGRKMSARGRLGKSDGTDLPPGS